MDYYDARLKQLREIVAEKIIGPFIDRLIADGVLSEVTNQIQVTWEPWAGYGRLVPPPIDLCAVLPDHVVNRGGTDVQEET